MPNVTRFPPSTDQEVPLRATNEKIAKLAAAKPAVDIHSAFVLVAQLATEAVGVATQLEKIPGIEPGQMQSVIDFWYRLSDLARTAALRCVGGNQTLAEATVTFMFLQTSCGRKPAGTETASPAEQGKVVGQ
jgi:hypothetical protein